MKRKRIKPRRRHQYGPDWGRFDQRTNDEIARPRRSADELRLETPHEVVDVPPVEVCEPQFREVVMTNQEKSDKILQNLAQVREVIDDVSQEVHRIQREAPDSVPRRFRVHSIHNREFPVDMLRYDNCVPDDEADAHAIERSFEMHEGRIFVTLRKLTQGDPSYSRWASMGWVVEE